MDQNHNEAPLMPVRFEWRKQYDDARDAYERDLSDSRNDEPSLTIQSFAKDTDLNEIVRRFGITDGAVAPQAADPRYYGDFTDTVDLAEARLRIKEAYDHFDQLPAELRTRFNNDPLELFNWVTDPANTEEAVELKILSTEGAARVPKTQEEKRQLEISKLEQRIKELETPVPTPATIAPATTTPTKAGVI